MICEVGDTLSSLETTDHDAPDPPTDRLEKLVRLPVGTILQGRFYLYLLTGDGYKRSRGDCETIEVNTRVIRFLPQTPPKIGDVLTLEQIKNLPDNSTMLYTFNNAPHGIWIKKGQKLFTVGFGNKPLRGFSIEVDCVSLMVNDKFELLYIGEES